MDYYLEFKILDDPEFVPSQLMNALFGKLHRALVQLNNQRIGVSFPEAKNASPYLGKRLRLHGTVADLDALMCLNWLTGMRDHVALSELLPVPESVQYRVVRRVQALSNLERLQRRCIKRHGVNEQEARRRYAGASVQHLELPFVSIRSQSTGQHFRLFVEQGALLSEPQAGLFGCYGLSATATVPWF